MFRRYPAGFSLIELLIVVALLGVLAALAMPFLLAARVSGNEASAIGSLRAITSAEANFATTCGGGHYSVNLNTLIDERYLSPDLGFNAKSGYNLALAASVDGIAGAADCAGDVPHTEYYATAVPMSEALGTRAFATTSVGTIWQDSTGAAPTEPFTAGGTVTPIQ